MRSEEARERLFLFEKKNHLFGAKKVNSEIYYLAIYICM